MSKTLLFFCLTILAFVGIGVAVAPQSPLFLLASGGTNLQHVRIIISVILAIQLVTRPPRHVWFRVLAGSIAAYTAIWAIGQTYDYHMQILDTMAFLGAAFAMFAAALERTSLSVPAVYIHNKTII
jgi:hypothetical protein